jgi:nucleoid-associated protein YgaU
VADSEFDAANQAIAEAEAAEADRYSPDLMNAARKALQDAKAKASSDPEGARALLAAAADTAKQARDASLALRLQAALDRLTKAAELLKGQKADKWKPDEAAALDARRQQAEAGLKADYSAGLPESQATLDAMAALLKALTERLTTVQALQKSVLGALDEADKADAFVWVPDELQQANDTYFAGTGQYKKFQLDKAEETWTAALFQAQSATAKAIRELARKQTEQLMLDTMRKLEKASGTTVVDPQDNIIAPQPWNGTEQLKSLKKPQSSLPLPEMALIPLDGSVVVLADKQRVTYLDEAKAAWTRGVTAMTAEDYPLANQEFLQSQKLIDAYLALAVDKLYTVRLIPDHRDSLWRISEYDGIYGSPWDWPKIWKRNQKLIQNPDLIYPGWQLIIPPQ